MQDSEEIFRRMDRDRLFYQAHRDELVQQYPEQWVAILDEQVVGVDADFDRLLADMRARGVPPEEAMIEYLTNKNDILILPG